MSPILSEFEDLGSDLPDLCNKCHKRFAVLLGWCEHCIVEEEPDMELIYRDDR